jgi:hypothetical protein
MDWIALAGLIARYGLPFVEGLMENAANNKPVTLAEWQALKAKIEIPGEVLVPKRPGV